MYRQLVLPNSEAHGTGRDQSSGEEDGRADLIEPTVAAYEAIADVGSRELARELMNRADARWANIGEEYGYFAGPWTMARLWRLSDIDALLASHGLSFRADGTMYSSPAVPGRGWLGQLRWGADAAASGSRFLLLAQPIGAAATLRQQLERWTENRAPAVGIGPRQSSRSEYIREVWRGFPRRLDYQKLYDEMSEVMHGRGALLPVVRWEAAGLAKWPPPDEVGGMVALAELGVLIQFQVLGAILSTLTGVTPAIRERVTSKRLVGDPPPKDTYQAVLQAIVPLSPPVLASPLVLSLIEDAETYEADLSRGVGRQRIPESVLPVLAFLHRRHRAVQTAVGALESESHALGEEFDLSILAHRERYYTLLAEAAALASLWSDGSGADSFATASSALRSAFVLWLEDDTRSMICVRTIYESTAKLRARRVRPSKARKLEERGETSTLRDWADAAGWKRLAVLNRALGELAHFDFDVRWGGAIEALGAIQPGAAENPHAINTARGSTLDSVCQLLAREVVEAVRPLSSSLATAFEGILGVGQNDAVVEEWLESARANRSRDFGTPSFVRVDKAHATSPAGHIAPGDGGHSLVEPPMEEGDEGQ